MGGRGKPVNLDNLVDALDYVSGGELLGAEAYLCIRSGEIYYRSDDYEDDNALLPEGVASSEEYIAVPEKRELDLGRGLVLRFVADVLPDAVDDVRNIFRKEGAYRRFKDLLERRGVLERWYEFENANQRGALKEWCVEHDISFTE